MHIVRYKIDKLKQWQKSETYQVSRGPIHCPHVACAGLRYQLDELESLRAVVPAHGGDNRLHALNGKL